MMKSLTISSILIALVAVGCGGKNKKAETAAVTPETSRNPDRDRAGTTDRNTDALDGDAAERVRLAELARVIYFEFDSSSLSAESRDALAKNAEWLAADPSRRLTIEGHTDEVGTDEYNLALGERRARAAFDFLIRLGIEADRIDVITFGEERPASAADPENRRAMFVVEKPRG